eukprot:3408110-Prymnesium_polylepis.1
MDEFKAFVAAETEKLKALAKANVANAEARLGAATTAQERVEAERAWNKARMKATSKAIKRSIFSLCVFQLEDMILDVIDEYFRQEGWTVGSLQFDGLFPEHREDASLSDAMRAAEAAVKESLGYTIQLAEKDLYKAD